MSVGFVEVSAQVEYQLARVEGLLSVSASNRADIERRFNLLARLFQDHIEVAAHFVGQYAGLRERWEARAVAPRGDAGPADRHPAAEAVQGFDGEEDGFVVVEGPQGAGVVEIDTIGAGEPPEFNPYLYLLARGILNECIHPGQQRAGPSSLTGYVVGVLRTAAALVGYDDQSIRTTFPETIGELETLFQHVSQLQRLQDENVYMHRFLDEGDHFAELLDLFGREGIFEVQADGRLVWSQARACEFHPLREDARPPMGIRDPQGGYAWSGRHCFDHEERLRVVDARYHGMRPQRDPEKPQIPLLAYQLESGKWVFQQQAGHGCTAGVTSMLALDHERRVEDDRVLTRDWGVTADMVADLRTAGLRPRTVSWPVARLLSEEDALQFLAEEIRAHDSAIVHIGRNHTGGHVIVVDAIDFEARRVLLREPYIGKGLAVPLNEFANCLTYTEGREIVQVERE